MLVHEYECLVVGIALVTVAFFGAVEVGDGEGSEGGIVEVEVH